MPGVSENRDRNQGGGGSRGRVLAVAIRFLWLLLALTFLQACARRRDPQAAFDHAMVAFRRGDVSSAEQEAKRGYEQFHGLSADWSWKFKILEADALKWRGMNDQVLALLASEAVPSPPGYLSTRKRILEGAALASLHRFPEADQKFSEAGRLCAESGASTCSDVSLERGVMEMARGRFGAAQDYFDQVLKAARERKDQFREAVALLDLSWSTLQQEHLDQAVDRAESSYRLSVAVGSEDTAQNALGNLGWAYYKLGEPERAEKLFVEARERAAHLGDIDDEVRWLTTVGYIYLDAAESDKARQSYQQALDLAQKINSREDILNALMSLALVSERTGHLDQARDYADKTILLAPADGNRLDILYPMLVKGHVAARQHDTAQAEKTFREIEQDPKSHVFLKWEAEHSLAQLYEDESQPASAEREYRAALSTFETARSSLQHEESSLPFPANASSIYDDYIRFLVTQDKTAEALQVAEYTRGRALAEGLGLLQKGTSFKPDPPNAQAIARKAGGTILFYWLGEKQSYLWAITAQKTSLFTLPPKSEIDPTVQRYRKALAEQQDFLQTTDADGRALYRTLVAPAQPLLAKNAQVFIIPDGSLNTLNFETLLVSDPTPHYWIEDVTIADANSLRLLGAQHAASKSTGSLASAGQRRRAEPGLPRAAESGRGNGEHRKTFPARTTTDVRPRSSHSGGVSGEQARAVLLRPLRRPRNGKPHQPARLRHRALPVRRRQRRFLQALRPRHHSSTSAGRAGNNFHLLRSRRTRLLGRGPGRTLLGISPCRSPQRDRSSLGGQ